MSSSIRPDASRGRIKDDPGATARPVPPCAISGGESSASPFALSPFRSHEKSKALSSSNCWGGGRSLFSRLMAFAIPNS